MFESSFAKITTFIVPPMLSVSRADVAEVFYQSPGTDVALNVTKGG